MNKKFLSLILTGVFATSMVSTVHGHGLWAGDIKNTSPIGVANRMDQSLAVETIPTKTYGDADFDIVVTSPDKNYVNTDVPFQFKNITEDIIQMNAEGKVKILNAGIAKFVLFRAGNAEYNDFEKEITFSIKPKELTISNFDFNNKKAYFEGVLPEDSNSVNVDFSKLIAKNIGKADKDNISAIFTNFELTGSKKNCYTIDKEENVKATINRSNYYKVNYVGSDADKIINVPMQTGVEINTEYITNINGVRSGFLGWYIDDKIVSNEAKFTYYPTKDTTIVAKYDRIDQDMFFVRYVTDNSEIVPVEWVDNNSTLTNKYTPTKSGYIFAGWNLNKDTSVPFNVGDKITKNIALYAVWKPNYGGNPQDAIYVLLGGKYVAFDIPPQIINGRTMVPIRYIFEAMGAEVEWDGNNNCAVCKKGSSIVKITLNSKSMLVDNTTKTMDVAATAIGGRILVPARYVAEAFGYSVEWKGDTKTVVIK